MKFGYLREYVHFELENVYRLQLAYIQSSHRFFLEYDRILPLLLYKYKNINFS